MSCVAMFTISSFWCALAPTLALLIFFRILRGATGGGLQPHGQAILADMFSAEQRGMAFALYGMAVVVAPAIGPHSRRLDHRQIPVALDLSDQCAHQHCFAAAHA